MSGAGHGGAKGQAILDFFASRPAGATRKQAAEAVGCTVARVGETIRSHGGFEQDGTTYRLQTTAEPQLRAKVVRTERCEHERKAKRRLGTCKKCGEVAK